MLSIDIAGSDVLLLEHLVLDLNGTLTDRGTVIAGVAERLKLLTVDLDVHLATADTYGRALDISSQLGLPMHLIRSGSEKEALIRELGAGGVVAIGNGRNDARMLRAARLGIVVIGPEGAAWAALVAGDLVCRSIVEALDLLLDPVALCATLRS